MARRLRARLVGVVKIGSTTVSALAAERLSDPAFRRAHGLSLIRMSPAFAQRALHETLSEFQQAFRQLGVQRSLIAGGEVLRRKPELSPSPAWILSAEEEGRLAWAGVQAQHHHPICLVDIGGGSTELVSTRRAVSIPVGVESPPASLSNDWPDLHAEFGGQCAILVGGTAYAIATLVGIESESLTTPDRLLNQLKGYAQWSPERLMAQGISELRARLLPRGMELVSALLSVYPFQTVGWSPRGLLEGLWLAASLGRGLPR